MTSPARQSVDLDAFPDLTVIHLGFRFTSLAGLGALIGLGRGLRAITAHPPDGLLAADFCLYAPNHVGIRQYWRDFDSLEAFTRAEPHRGWWKGFAAGKPGTGFWHETYRKAGGIEAIYLGMPPTGLGRFAPPRMPVGPFHSARMRLSPAS